MLVTGRAVLYIRGLLGLSMWRATTTLIGVVLGLVTIGVVMLASTSGAVADVQYHDAFFFVKRQLVWLVVALFAGLATSCVRYDRWRWIAIPLFLSCLVLLLLAIIPHIGVSVKGSSRWLRIGPANFQPSELAKLATIILLAWWLEREQRHAKELARGLIVPLVMLGVPLLLILIEPDFGTTMLIGLVGLSMIFIAGSRISYVLVAVVSGAAFFTFVIMQNVVRMRRIIAFLDPEKYAQDEAFQLLNAIYAFVWGGGWGVGLGQSLQKQFYLPEAHTDFIFAILGEELGLGGSLAVVILFLIFFACGMWISYRAADDFGRMLAFGISLLITLQAAVNIGVVTGCLPTKGLPLPFISFGGSSLVVALAMVGILINIAKSSTARDDVGLAANRDADKVFWE